MSAVGNSYQVFGRDRKVSEQAVKYIVSGVTA
jgi:hypothetical protein